MLTHVYTLLQFLPHSANTLSLLVLSVILPNRPSDNAMQFLYLLNNYQVYAPLILNHNNKWNIEIGSWLVSNQTLAILCLITKNRLRLHHYYLPQSDYNYSLIMIVITQFWLWFLQKIRKNQTMLSLPDSYCLRQAVWVTSSPRYIAYLQLRKLVGSRLVNPQHACVRGL